MADLVTHVCTGLLPAALFRPRLAVPLAVGTVLPDLTGRVPQMALALLDVRLPVRILWALDVAHTPVAQTLLAVALGQAVVARQRRETTAWLLVGVALHFALDVLQDHHGNGYHLGYPLTLTRYELGWIGSEATVAWAPWIALVTLAVWGARLKERRSARVRRAPPRP